MPTVGGCYARAKLQSRVKTAMRLWNDWTSFVASKPLTPISTTGWHVAGGKCCGLIRLNLAVQTGRYECK